VARGEENDRKGCGAPHRRYRRNNAMVPWQSGRGSGTAAETPGSSGHSPFAEPVDPRRGSP
jgi:hypothetical protein